MAIQFRRGTQAEWEAKKSNIVAGEPVVTTDTEHLYVGYANGGFFEVATQDDITDIEDRFPVQTADIADYTITTAKIVNGAVTEEKIDSNAVTNFQLANNAVEMENIADGAVVTSKLEDGAITTPKILDEAVTTAKLDDGAVTSGKIANSVYGTANPQMDGTASAGSSSSVSRADHVHPKDTTKADATDLGSIANLTTTNKTSAVAAINEVNEELGTVQGTMVYFDSEGYLCFQSLAQ